MLCVDWIDLAQEGGQMVVLNTQVPLTSGNYLVEKPFSSQEALSCM
jgi:hypothetical protein